MIVIKNPAFVKTSNFTQTRELVQHLHVMFMTPEKGKITGWLKLGNEVETDFREIETGFITNYEQSYFVSTRTRILNIIQDDLKAQLEALNPELEFNIQ